MTQTDRLRLVSTRYGYTLPAPPPPPWARDAFKSALAHSRGLPLPEAPVGDADVVDDPGECRSFPDVVGAGELEVDVRDAGELGGLGVEDEFVGLLVIVEVGEEDAC